MTTTTGIATQPRLSDLPHGSLERRQAVATTFRLADLNAAADQRGLTLGTDEPNADLNVNPNDTEKVEISLTLLGELMGIEFKKPFPTA